MDGKTAFERPLPEPSRERITAGSSSKFNNVYFGSGLALSGVIPAARPQDAHDALAKIEQLPGIADAGQDRYGALQAQWHRVDHQGSRAPFEPVGIGGCIIVDFLAFALHPCRRPFRANVHGSA